MEVQRLHVCFCMRNHVFFADRRRNETRSGNPRDPFRNTALRSRYIAGQGGIVILFVAITGPIRVLTSRRPSCIACLRTALTRFPLS